MNVHAQRFVILGAVMAVIAAVVTAVAWPSRYRVKVRRLDFEPSGLYDQAGAELPFVTARLFLPTFDGWDVEFPQDPFGVECKVRGRWVKIENRASIRWSIQNEMSFLIWPGTEMCRLHFKYQREPLRWRLLRAIVPGNRFQPGSWFSRWVWWKSPFGPKLVELMYHRNHFRRPPHWSEMTAEIAIPSGAASRERIHATE